MYFCLDDKIKINVILQNLVQYNKNKNIKIAKNMEIMRTIILYNNTLS